MHGTFASSIGRLSRALQMESYPTFHNEVGVPIVRIGCREFKCIGDKPPQDHPHIYLKIGDAGEIVCPYCSTLFRFDPSLGAHEADPADCASDSFAFLASGQAYVKPFRSHPTLKFSAEVFPLLGTSS